MDMLPLYYAKGDTYQRLKLTEKTFGGNGPSTLRSTLCRGMGVSLAAWEGTTFDLRESAKGDTAFSLEGQNLLPSLKDYITGESEPPIGQCECLYLSVASFPKQGRAPVSQKQKRPVSTSSHPAAASALTSNTCSKSAWSLHQNSMLHITEEAQKIILLVKDVWEDDDALCASMDSFTGLPEDSFVLNMHAEGLEKLAAKVCFSFVLDFL